MIHYIYTFDNTFGTSAHNEIQQSVIVVYFFISVVIVSKVRSRSGFKAQPMQGLSLFVS